MQRVLAPAQGRRLGGLRLRSGPQASEGLRLHRQDLVQTEQAAGPAHLAPASAEIGQGLLVPPVGDHAEPERGRRVHIADVGVQRLVEGGCRLPLGQHYLRAQCVAGGPEVVARGFQLRHRAPGLPQAKAHPGRCEAQLRVGELVRQHRYDVAGFRVGEVHQHEPLGGRQPRRLPLAAGPVEMVQPLLRIAPPVHAPVRCRAVPAPQALDVRPLQVPSAGLRFDRQISAEVERHELGRRGPEVPASDRHAEDKEASQLSPLLRRERPERGRAAVVDVVRYEEVVLRDPLGLHRASELLAGLPAERRDEVDLPRTAAVLADDARLPGVDLPLLLQPGGYEGGVRPGDPQGLCHARLGHLPGGIDLYRRGHVPVAVQVQERAFGEREFVHAPDPFSLFINGPNTFHTSRN